MLVDSIIFWLMLCWLSGMVISFALIPYIREWAIRKDLLDRAGQFHMTHTIAVPRLGGLALFASFIAVLVLIYLAHLRGRVNFPEETALIFFNCMAIFGLGFWDDLRPLGARIKLTVQILIAMGAYIGGLGIGQWVNPFTDTVHHLGVLDGPLTVLWIVGVTNLINLVDGVDGLAAGLSLLLMLLLAVVSGMSGNFFSLLLAIGIAGALLGFLGHNFPPAKIFMGDGGAYFLGMLIAEMALLNARKGEVAAALIAPFFALGLPLIDASFTIIRRGLSGVPIFRADRRHIHHRLVAMGFSKRNVVLVLYAVCGFFALLALGVFVSKGRLLPVLFGVFMIVMIVSVRAFGFVQDWYKLGRLLTNSVIRRKYTKYAILLGQVLLMEAEHCHSLEALWKNFGLILEKLGFQSVQYRSGDEEKIWNAPVQPDAEIEMRSISQGSKETSEMVFRYEAGKWDEETPQLLSELAYEAWVNASTVWMRIHQGGQ